MAQIDSKLALSKAALAVSMAVSAALTGCADTSGGSATRLGSGVGSTQPINLGSGGDPGTVAGNSGAGSGSGGSTGVGDGGSAGGPVASANGTSDVGGLGAVVSNVGKTVAAVNAGAQTPTALQNGGVLSAVDAAGAATSDIGHGLTAGVGSPGAGSDPLATTLTAVANGVTTQGDGVSASGNAIRAIGDGTPLRPVVDATGKTVVVAGRAVSRLGKDTNDVVNSDAVQPVTRAGSALIEPIVVAVDQASGVIGATPAGNLVTTTGIGVAKLGANISGSSSTPLVQSTGATVTSLGNAVAVIGGGSAVSGTPGAPSLETVVAPIGAISGTVTPITAGAGAVVPNVVAVGAVVVASPSTVGAAVGNATPALVPILATVSNGPLPALVAPLTAAPTSGVLGGVELVPVTKPGH